jgi:hypothetical protein
VLAHDQAVSYYRQALELLEVARGVVDETQHLDLLISLGEAQRRAGEPRYRETLLTAARVASSRGDAHRLARAALANHRGMFSTTLGVDAERMAMLEAALTEYRRGDDPVRARLLATLGAELVFADDRDRRLALSGEALTMARRIGDASTLANVLLSHAAAIYCDPILLDDWLSSLATRTSGHWRHITATVRPIRQERSKTPTGRSSHWSGRLRMEPSRSYAGWPWSRGRGDWWLRDDWRTVRHWLARPWSSVSPADSPTPRRSSGRSGSRSAISRDASRRL